METHPCPVCHRQIADYELQNSECPRCHTVLIKTDSGEYVEVTD